MAETPIARLLRRSFLLATAEIEAAVPGRPARVEIVWRRGPQEDARARHIGRPELGYLVEHFYDGSIIGADRTVNSRIRSTTPIDDA